MQSDSLEVSLNEELEFGDLKEKKQRDLKERKGGYF